MHTVIDSLCPLVFQLVHKDGHLDHLAQHQQLRLPAPEVWFLEPLTVPASGQHPSLAQGKRLHTPEDHVPGAAGSACRGPGRLRKGKQNSTKPQQRHEARHKWVIGPLPLAGVCRRHHQPQLRRNGNARLKPPYLQRGQLELLMLRPYRA